jgi:hypothetical protein
VKQPQPISRERADVARKLVLRNRQLRGSQEPPVMLRVLLTGDRAWVDREVVREVLGLFPPGTEILVGDCPTGLDRMALGLACEMGMRRRTFAADWHLHGLAAGPLRNKAMLDARPDMVVAFHRDLKRSKGTKDCVNQAVRRGLPIHLVDGRDPLVKRLY